MAELLFQDGTEQMTAVYSGKPVRDYIGEVTLNGTTEQEIEIATPSVNRTGNVQVILECSQADSGAASTQVQAKYAPRVQHSDGTFSKTNQDAVVIGSAVSDLSTLAKEPEVLDIPLHIVAAGSPHHHMSPYGFYLYIFGEAVSDAKIEIYTLRF